MRPLRLHPEPRRQHRSFPPVHCSLIQSCSHLLSLFTHLSQKELFTFYPLPTRQPRTTLMTLTGIQLKDRSQEGGTLSPLRGRSLGQQRRFAHPALHACVSDRAEGPRSGTALVMAEYVGESLSHQEIRAVAAMRHTIAMVSVYSANDYFPLYQAPQPSISPRAALLRAPMRAYPSRATEPGGGQQLLPRKPKAGRTAPGRPHQSQVRELAALSFVLTFPEHSDSSLSLSLGCVRACVRACVCVCVCVLSQSVGKPFGGQQTESEVCQTGGLGRLS